MSVTSCPRTRAGAVIVATAIAATVLIGSGAAAVVVPTLPPFIASLNSTCSAFDAPTGFVSVSLGNPDGDEGGARTYAWSVNEFDGAIGPLVDSGDVVVDDGGSATVAAGPMDSGQYVFSAYDVSLPDLSVSSDFVINQCQPPPSTSTTATTTTTTTLVATTSSDPAASTTVVMVPTSAPVTTVPTVPTSGPTTPPVTVAPTGQTLPATGGAIPAISALGGLVVALVGGTVLIAVRRRPSP